MRDMRMNPSVKMERIELSIQFWGLYGASTRSDQGILILFYDPLSVFCGVVTVPRFPEAHSFLTRSFHDHPFSPHKGLFSFFLWRSKRNKAVETSNSALKSSEFKLFNAGSTIKIGHFLDDIKSFEIKVPNPEIS